MSILTPAPPAPATSGQPLRQPLSVVLAAQRAGQVVHVEHLPGAEGKQVAWPDWVTADVAIGFARNGIHRPWSHQAQAADLAWAGQDVIIATRAASGKSVGYLAPALTAIAAGGTALYIAPTKALAADQLAAVQSLAVPGVRAACYDGDSSRAERAWAQAHAGYLLTNPDMLHGSLLPRHARWAGFLRRLRFVIVDECHGYRGVFGSHVAHVLRRLRRIAAHYAQPGEHAEPVFILASATIGEPGSSARLLTGKQAAEVTADGAPRSPVSFALWKPPTTAKRRRGERVRKTATAETTDLLTGLVAAGIPTLAFVKSRREAEVVALTARRALGGEEQVAAYRSGYLAEDRRRLESALRDGKLTGLAATTALELGINIPSLDAVLITGWPGTWASLWQQAGRAGRTGRDATAVFIARDDPLDSYLIQHPQTLLHHPVEATVLDPANPYVLAPHLCAAAAELPLSNADLDLFGAAAADAVAELTAAGRLRRRRSGWFAAHRGHAARQVSLRGSGAPPVRVVEQATGRLVGTIDEPSAHLLVHDGAVYLHQGDTYLVHRLDLDERVALVEERDPGYTTAARGVTEIEVLEPLRQVRWGEAELVFGDVQVRRQVVSFATIRSENQKRVSQTALSLPPRALRTRAFWWTIPNDKLLRLAADGVDLAGAAHAAEHASIGMLPLFATCDRWDVGGVSTELYPATGRLTVFVYDGHEGGAGFAERGFAAAAAWLRATRDAIACCECQAGCPSCVQSPKCGNGNNPLSKSGAIMLLDTLLADAPRARAGADGPSTPSLVTET